MKPIAPRHDWPPLVSEFQERLNKSFLRVLGTSIEALASEYGTAYVADFEEHLVVLRAAYPERPWPGWAVQGYVQLNKAILVEEMRFRETGSYTATPDQLPRVIDEVYANPDVMDRFYLVGLYCSYFLWPHHYRILNFFRESFLDIGDAPDRFAEWGVGHGLLALEALGRWPQASVTFADISEHSLAFAARIAAAAGHARHVDMLRQDVVEDPPPGRVGRLICSELLEHVPDPDRLLDRVHDALEPGGHAYLTGALNAAQPDHISLFEDSDALLRRIESHRLLVKARITVCHPNREHEERPPGVLAVVVQREA